MVRKRQKKDINLSKNVGNGTILHTRDEFFYGAKGYNKPGKSNNDFYRQAVVIDSNNADELAVVKMTTKNGKLPKGSTGDYIYTKDNKNMPIKTSRKFKKGKKNVGLDKASKIYDKLISDKKFGKENRKRIAALKGQKK